MSHSGAPVFGSSNILGRPCTTDITSMVYWVPTPSFTLSLNPKALEFTPPKIFTPFVFPSDPHLRCTDWQRFSFQLLPPRQFTPVPAGPKNSPVSTKQGFPTPVINCLSASQLLKINVNTSPTSFDLPPPSQKSTFLSPPEVP